MFRFLPLFKSKPSCNAEAELSESRMVRSLHKVIDHHKSKRSLAETELELAMAQGRDLCRQFNAARQQRDQLAKAVAIHMGKRKAPGDYELMLPRSSALQLHPAEAVTIAEKGPYLVVSYRDTRKVFCESPMSAIERQGPPGPLE